MFNREIIIKCLPSLLHLVLPTEGHNHEDFNYTVWPYSQELKICFQNLHSFFMENTRLTQKTPGSSLIPL
jgi:hypothetical protein